MKRTTVGLMTGLVLSVAAIQVATVPQGYADSRSTTNSLDRAFQRGDYNLARELALRHDDAPSLIARARLAWMDGDFAKITKFSNAAFKKATKKEHKTAALVMRSHAEVAQGKWKIAEATLRAALKLDANAHEARFRLGELLYNQGKIVEGKAIMDAFTAMFNNGQMKTADGLVSLARAMWLMERFDDANYALKQAVAKDKKHVEALTVWGQLLLAKYNVREAYASFRDALRINPKYPEALIGMAQVHMLRSNRGDNARAYLKKASAVAPKHPMLHLTHAHLSIRDDDCTTAQKDAATVLKDRPKDLEALTVQAICHYLDDDMTKYKATRDKALKINPKYALLLSRTADYGIRAHRYIEAMSLYREALKLIPDHSPALLGLGMGLSRIGKEDEALVYLKKAYDEDQYNKRAYYMVELYEKVMPRYEFTLYKGFKLRAHRDQREMINLFVAPVVEEALNAFTKKYGQAPWKDLAVEVYPNSQTFGVRSVGLPNISPHGICFGKVVTVRSPSDGNFNWKQVVWHELAHTYHLYVSKSRVPRWFTEGLAEYETNVYDKAWNRHHDEEIAVKLQKNEIPSVLNLSRGFTHAKSHQEILRSYHLASLAIHFIAETYKFKSIVGMLKAWGDKKDTEGVIKDVLGISVKKFDAQFLAWLKRRYMNFDNQMMLDIESFPSAAELERKIARNALNSKAWSQAALVYLYNRKMERANEAIEKALSIAPKDPEVNHIALIIRFNQGRSKDALKHGNAILAAFKDSYSIRMMMGRAAMLTEDIKTARVHYEAAVQMYPTGVRGWTALAKLGKNTKDNKLFKTAISKLYLLNQNDPLVARVYTNQLLEIKAQKLAYLSAQRWVQINPFDTEAQKMMLKLGLEQKDYTSAKQSWDALLLLQKDKEDQKRLYKDAIETLDKLGKKTDADAYRKRAKKAGVTL